MNAVHHITPLGKFKWLLKREYWENRGGFLRAPLVAGGISLLLTLMAIIAGLWAGHRAANNGDLHIDGVRVNGLNLDTLTRHMSPEDIAKLGDGMNFTLLASGAWPFIVLAFVVFFYCLGALYDDRRDRSVLFWKSMPLSDTQTVLSKLVSAVVVAPVLATLAAIVTMFGFIAMISIVVLAHGGNPVTLIWGPSRPFTIAAGLLCWVPVYALWALPTVGWLMLCSAWARSKPFLWAILIPVFSGILISWFNLMNVFHLNDGWYWKNIVFRGLFSVFPGTWYASSSMQDAMSMKVDNPGDLANAIQIGKSWAVFGSAELWIGALAGAAMIYAAIRLRRWRDDN